MDEVQLVLRVVVVEEARVTGREDGRVDAERGHAERLADLAEARALAELVERREGVAHAGSSPVVQAGDVSASGRRPSSSASVPLLLGAEPRAEQLLDVGAVHPRGLLELGQTGVGQHRVGDAGVGVAARLRHPAGALEPVEQARDPGGGEDDRPGEVDPPQPVVGREVELHEHVVVAQRQPVLRLEAARELARDRRVRPEEADPGGQIRLGDNLCAQYLTRQDSLAKIFDIASIYPVSPGGNSTHVRHRNRQGIRSGRHVERRSGSFARRVRGRVRRRQHVPRQLRRLLRRPHRRLGARARGLGQGRERRREGREPQRPSADARTSSTPPAIRRSPSRRPSCTASTTTPSRAPAS